MFPVRSILLAFVLAFVSGIFLAARGQEFKMVFADNQGKVPTANLCLGSDGNFYGTTMGGGPSDKGTVFKVTSTGELTTLLCFNGFNGNRPNGVLVQGTDGNFYGTTALGGTGYGTIFKVTPQGEHTLLVSLTGANGRDPGAGLLLASDGNFYGTTENGGASGNGTLFKMTPAGVLTTLVNFTGTNGRMPTSELVEGSDGNFYGTTGYGGPNDSGTVFKVTPEGTLTTLVTFSASTNGSYPVAGLTAGDDGNFYGVTFGGGENGDGTVFKITSAGELTTLASFGTGTASGNQPHTKLFKWNDGNFYGTTQSGGEFDQGSVFKVTPTGTITTIVSLRSHSPSGSQTYSGLIAGNDGTFYGSTTVGGEANSGVIFKVTPAGEVTRLTSLYFFKNGRDPRAGLVEGADGSFYGTAELGGPGSVGTAFKVTASGEMTRLASFGEIAGRYPSTGILAASNGNFYGTTAEGGDNNRGTIFKVTPAGEVSTLVSLTSAIGSRPSAELVEGSDGNFYGTMQYGGPDNCGSVFKVTPAGELTLLHFFNGTDGRQPTSGLCLGSDGNFYGTTETGGLHNRGVFFTITPAGVLTKLYTFDPNNHTPSGKLVEWTDGNFYGTTQFGGADNCGSVFKMTPSGNLTTICHLSFSRGYFARSGVVAGVDGNFYGVAEAGGDTNAVVTNGLMGFGTIFKVSPAGDFTRLHSFDGLQAAFPVGKPVFGSDGKLYGMAGQMAVWRLSVPMVPAVTLGSPNSITPNGATLTGTVNANGTGANVTFEYGPTPAFGTSINATPETVTGGSATAVSATLTGLLPHTTYHYRLTASSQAGRNNTVAGTFTTGNNLPTAANDSYVSDPNGAGSVFLLVLDNDSDPDGDPLTITVSTQGSFGTVTTNGQKLVYTPGPGFLGRDSFTYTVSDGFGTATAQVELRATALFQRILFARNSEVPGAGDDNSEIAGGSRFQSFGVPSINSAGKLAVASSYGIPGSTSSEHSVLLIDPKASKSKVAALRKQVAPGTEGALFASFKDPLLNEAGDVAILATLSTGGTKSNKDGIWVSPASAGGSNGTKLIARTGTQPPGTSEGARWKSFTSVAFSNSSDAISGEPGSWWLAFTGFMTAGPGGVSAKNDMGLWIATPTRTVLALREYQPLLVLNGKEKRVKTFAALKPLPNAVGQGKGVNKLGCVAVQVFFTDGTQAMIHLSWVDGDDEEPNLVFEYTFPDQSITGVSEKPVKFGVPAQNNSGTKSNWIGTLSGKVDPIAIFERDLTNSELLLMARQGGTNTGIEETSFSNFGGVTVNDSDSTLFLGKIKGRGISKANDEGLWWRRWNGETFSLDLLAREGEHASGLPEGVRWTNFSSIALPDGECGPLFTAGLTGSKGMPSIDRIHSGNDQGLWAVDSSGELRLVIREGQEVTSPGSTVPQKLKSFTVLSAVAGSPAQRRSFDTKGRIVYRALFTDNSQAIITVQLP